MLSDAQQDDVWEGLISCATRANCFAELCNEYSRRHRNVLWATLFFSWCAASVVVKDWLPSEYQWIRVALTIITAALSFVSAVQQYQKKSSECLDLHYRWNKLANLYDDLWNSTNSPDAVKRLRSLREQSHEVSKASVPFGENKKLMTKWQAAIEQQYKPQ